ncbi:hypothetical protein RHMOL_Rhmol06G0286100 [Rhododendron molle]|uniref:Uncharacterized protein n=1 Tax=Rhododendron molle TaxID=49168 RepID=A0ACC0NJB1_RHOML|nr:hypothetical protein RHMOL_Rhmol06G0286100 [Rhododendron molle]
MATSVSVCPDDAVGGLDDEYSRRENGKQSGRRKPKSNEKKKQPQRGMGVAQLGRLSNGDALDVNQGFLLPKLGNGGFSGQVGVGQLEAEPYGFGYSYSGFRAGNVARETSNELSSMPNVNCYNGQCDLCHKKKRIVDRENLVCNGMRDKNAGCRFLGFNHGDKEKLDQVKP